MRVHQLGESYRIIDETPTTSFQYLHHLLSKIPPIE
jgi:hypothetical protein